MEGSVAERKFPCRLCVLCLEVPILTPFSSQPTFPPPSTLHHTPVRTPHILDRRLLLHSTNFRPLHLQSLARNPQLESHGPHLVLWLEAQTLNPDTGFATRQSRVQVARRTLRCCARTPPPKPPTLPHGSSRGGCRQYEVLQYWFRGVVRICVVLLVLRILLQVVESFLCTGQYSVNEGEKKWNGWYRERYNV